MTFDHVPPLSEMLYEMTLTKDGAVTLSAANQAQQVGLLAAIDQLHLFADERFNSQEKIIANIDEFRDVLKAEFMKFETDDLLQRLKENDVPASKCLPYPEVLAHEQYAANNSIDEAKHPLIGQHASGEVTRAV